MFFFSILFLSTRVRQVWSKIWSFWPLRHRAKFIAGMGPVQNAMGRTLFFIALKHGADFFFSFFLQSPAMGRILFFHCLEASEKIFTEKKAVAAIFFTETAESDWNTVVPIEVNWKKFWNRAQPVQRILCVVIFFYDSTYEKKYDLPQYEIFCLIVWGKMIECHGARTFFSCCQPWGEYSFSSFFAMWHFFFFHTTIYICTGPMPQ